MAFQLGSAPLKRFYKYLLKRVIGSFLKRDIDLDQLEVQLWSGQVQLRSIELDVSSLNALPGLRCTAANLGSVKMVVPWRRLVSDHCKVYISGLHLIFTRADHCKAPSPAEENTPPGFFQEGEVPAKNEESRYTEEGIETLSRLVKRVLGRMEVCLHDLSVIAKLKPCQLRARLSSVVLFSEEGDTEPMKTRRLRVGMASLSMAPPPLQEIVPEEENMEQPMVQQDIEFDAGEVMVLSTRGQESASAAAGVMELRREGCQRFFSSLRLPAIRIAFTAASCCMLGEALTILSQALRKPPATRQMPDIEDLENNPETGEVEEEESPPPMVQSLLFQSAMANSPGHFWQDLYSLFQADDQLASAAAGDEDRGAVEGENAAPDQQEQEAFMDVLEGEELKGTTEKLSLEVEIGQVTAVLCLEHKELWSPSSHPKPRSVPALALPMQRPEHQGQLCIGGLSFGLEKNLTQAQEATWNLGAESMGLHLHWYEDEAEDEVGPSELPGGRSLAASELFRSAYSHFPNASGHRTPSLASEKCLTEESLSESESFGQSSVHSMSAPSPKGSDIEEDEDPGLDSDEELHDAFFKASIQHLLPKIRRRTMPSTSGGRGEWLRSSPQFWSKQVLDFMDDGGSSSSSSPWPNSPAPGRDHPIWNTLGFREGVTRKWWVATAEDGQTQSLRFGCLPLQINLCSSSVKLLHLFASHRKGAELSASEEHPRDAWRETHQTHGLPVERSRNSQRFVAVAPAIRIVLRLPDATAVIGDVVLPRLLAPNLPEEQDAYLEALRFDAASAVLYLSTPQEVTELLSLRRPGSARGFVHRNAAIELALLTKQAQEGPHSAPSSPEKVSPVEAAEDSPPLAGWTRLTALRPSAPGPLPLPPAAEPAKDTAEPADDTTSGGESCHSRLPMELEMSIPGEVECQVSIGHLGHLKQQAQAFLSEFPKEPKAPAENPENPSVPASLGFTASIGSLTCRIEDDAEDLNELERNRVTAVQLCFTSCCVRGASAMAEDMRFECLVQEGRRSPTIHTLLRPWSKPPCPRQGGDGTTELGDVTLSSYLWKAFPRRPRPHTSSWSIEVSLKGETLHLQLTRLVFLCQRPLLEQCHWLSRLQEVFKARADGGTEAKTHPPKRESETTRSLSLRAQLSECFIDLPSVVPGDAAVSSQDPGDGWRIVLDLKSLEGRLHTQAPLRGSLRSGRLEAYVSDGYSAGPAELEATEDLNLINMGFVPVVEISSASCTAVKETAEEVELRLGLVQCHLRADTARALRRVADELSTLLPVAPAVGMPEVVTQRAMPKDFDFGEETFLTATSNRFDETDNDILAGVDMFAFAPDATDASDRTQDVAPMTNALRDAMSDALQNALGGSPTPGPPELIRGASASTSSSCRVDEWLRAQELQQSPRSPVTACAAHEPEEGPFEMELLELPEAIDEEEREDEQSLTPAQSEIPDFDALQSSVEEHEGPEAQAPMAVCLFDPEVVSEERIRELCDEEAVARQQVEQQFQQEMAVTGSTVPPAPEQNQVRYQQGSSVLIFNLTTEITEDYFVRGELGNRKFEAPRWAPPATLVLRLHMDEVNLTVYQGADFRRPMATMSDKESIATDRQSRSHVIVHLRSLEAKLMQFAATLPRGVGARKLVEASTLRCRWVLGIRDFDIRDRVHGSVFSRVLACFEDEEKRPRPSMSDMLHCRVDELVHGTSDQPDEPKEVAPEYNVELQLLPLQLTVDQDTVEFLEDFWQLCSMSTYVEEQDGAQDYLAAAGIEQAELESSAGPADPAQALTGLAEATVVPLFFQQVTVGSLLLSVDYKAKRLDVEALRRGELWQLVNVLPLLEGLQVHFRNVTVHHARGYEKVLSQVVQAWSADLNRTQLLRSLTGVTPIRSIANIGGGFAEMVLEPLKQYRAGEDVEQVSRTMLRGVISFLRHMTIESIDLTERVFLGAQAALEYANTCLAEESPGVAPTQRRPAVNLPAESAGGGSSGSDWLPVERGAANFMQPGGAAEGLQEAGSNLTRGLRNAGPFLVKPLLEIQRGAPKKQVLRSVVSGIPMCFLRPAIGVTSAAVPAIRGVRNRLDPSHRREMVRKYRGPG